MYSVLPTLYFFKQFNFIEGTTECVFILKTLFYDEVALKIFFYHIILFSAVMIPLPVKKFDNKFAAKVQANIAMDHYNILTRAVTLFDHFIYFVMFL